MALRFGPINVFGIIIVIIMMIPNIIFARRFDKDKNKCGNIAMLAAEQIGRYASITLMFIPLVAGLKFGFRNEAMFLVYAFGNTGLLLAYILNWWSYFRKQSPKKTIILAVIPTCIFLLSGITLMHWLLVLAAVLFGIGHIYVTKQNNKA